MGMSRASRYVNSSTIFRAKWNISNGGELPQYSEKAEAPLACEHKPVASTIELCACDSPHFLPVLCNLCCRETECIVSQLACLWSQLGRGFLRRNRTRLPLLLPTVATHIAAILLLLLLLLLARLRFVAFVNITLLRILARRPGRPRPRRSAGLKSSRPVATTWRTNPSDAEHSTRPVKTIDRISQPLRARVPSLTAV